MKFLLLIILLFFALAIAAAVLRRLMHISERIANLQSDLKRNEVKMDVQMQKLSERQSVQPSAADSSRVDNNTVNNNVVDNEEKKS